MRPSLEQVNRFDPDRARQRLLVSFRPYYTRLIMVGDILAGCVALGPEAGGGLWLEHFYIAPLFQGRGLGEAVVRRLLCEADTTGMTVALSVLVESPANRFYARFGFVETHRVEYDIYYRRPVGAWTTDQTIVVDGGSTS